MSPVSPGRSPLVLVLEHDPTDPPLRVGEWLIEAGARIELRRAHSGDPIPETADGFDAVVCLGGDMGAWDDEVAPWLPATRRLLAQAVGKRVPTFGICLGAQLLAAATGGTVIVGPDGPERGAYLMARRDAALGDQVFGNLPMTPDVMHYHADIVSRLPPDSVLLLTSTGYPNQAWRQGENAWAVQFHIETDAADLRAWATPEDLGTRRFGPMLDDASEAMDQVWRDVIHRFVEIAAP